MYPFYKTVGRILTAKQLALQSQAHTEYLLEKLNKFL